jgi:hypothetical protein
MTYPNVPIAPGVPPIPRDPLAVALNVALLTADAFGLLFGNGSNQWGLFQNGSAVILADNVTALDFRKDWIIASYPVQRGAFESYDKVQTPFEMRLRFTTGGTVAERQAFLNSIFNIAGTTNLYDVYMPEASFSSVCIKHVDFDRTAQSVGLLAVDVWVEQVVQAAVPSFSNTASPNSASPVAQGQVQTQTPTQAQMAGIVSMFAIGVT